MKRIGAVVLVIVFFLGLSRIVFAEEKKSDGTRGSYRVYSQNLFQGKKEMRRGDFQQARIYFMMALESQRHTEALAFAATASYKMNDVQAAERYIDEAEKQTGRGVSELRIAGYKALTYLKERRDGEGMKALQEYTNLYSHLDPLMNIREVEAMVITGRVDLGKLEALIDEQIAQYEDEMEQYLSTGTGFYGRHD